MAGVGTCWVLGQPNAWYATPVSTIDDSVDLARVGPGRALDRGRDLASEKETPAWRTSQTGVFTLVAGPGFEPGTFGL